MKNNGEKVRSQKKNDIEDLAILGLLIALIAVSTMMITLPVPGTEGFIHLGDSMIFLSAIMFGRRKGTIAGGIGSAMADLLLGYTHWVLPTLIIKGLMGYIVGIISERESDKVYTVRNIVALIIGVSWMIVGYLIAGTILKGSFTVALASVPFNIVQGLGGAVLFVPIGIGLKKTKYFSKYVLK